jgi:(2Fe-2S) ferredoxin
MSEPFYKKHLFVCTNLKQDGKKCCHQGNAEAMAVYLKEQLQLRDLHGPGKIRVSQSGCLGRCSEGPNILVYPEGSWHSYASKEDIDKLIRALV